MSAETLFVPTPHTNPVVTPIYDGDEFKGWEVANFCNEHPELHYLVGENECGHWCYQNLKPGTIETDELVRLATFATQNYVIDHERIEHSPLAMAEATSEISAHISRNLGKKPIVKNHHHIEVYVTGIGATAANWVAMRLQKLAVYGSVTYREHPDGGWWYECHVEAAIGIDAKTTTEAVLAPYWIANYRIQEQLEE